MHRSLALLLPVLLFAGCPDLISPHPVVVEGRATEVRFPEPWIEHTSGNAKFLLPGGNLFYEIRKPADVTSNRLLFAGMSWVTMAPYPVDSENIIPMGFEVPPRAAEWQRAMCFGNVIGSTTGGLSRILSNGDTRSPSPGGKVMAVFRSEPCDGIIPFSDGGVKAAMCTSTLAPRSFLPFSCRAPADTGSKSARALRSSAGHAKALH